jgi:hypothetical protein
MNGELTEVLCRGEPCEAAETMACLSAAGFKARQAQQEEMETIVGKRSSLQPRIMPGRMVLRIREGIRVHESIRRLKAARSRARIYSRHCGEADQQGMGRCLRGRLRTGRSAAACTPQQVHAIVTTARERAQQRTCQITNSTHTEPAEDAIKRGPGQSICPAAIE